jgi:ribosome recycling factor
MVDEKIFKDAEEKMKRSIDNMLKDYSAIRTGRATPAMVEKIPVEAYGSECPLSQMGNISVPEARTLVIQPYDKTQIGNIERAIHKSDLGVSPMNDGQVIRLNFPPLTQDRRKDLVKVVKKRSEEAKIALRNIRRDLLEELKGIKDAREDEQKQGQEKIQKITDKYVADIGKQTDRKESEIMEV